jgi:hypothetical protein
MNKIFIVSFTMLLAVIWTVVTPLAKMQTVYMNQTQTVKAQAIPVSQFTIMPMSFVPDGASDPSTTILNPVYTENHEQIYMLKETGTLVTEKGKPIMDKNSSITKFDMETQEYSNGANQKLSIYFNSFLDKHYLRSGGNYVTAINTSREIYLINLKTSDGGRMAIYTYREKVDHGWSIIFKPGKWFNDEYRYYDMNGRLIDNKNIAEWDTATFAKAMGGNLLFFLATNWIGLVGQLIFGNADNFGVPYVKVYEKTTLADLMEELKYATIHPYETVENVVTEDGFPIYIRPVTKQCVDRFNFPLFSIENGLPVMLYDEVIVTSNLQGVEIQNGILHGVVSVWQLLESGTNFYMGSIPTPFGEMDAVVFNLSNDIDNPNWKLPNGDDADDIIKDMELGASLDGDSWSELFKNLGDLFDNAFDWVWTVIVILLIVLIGIPCLPIIIEIVKALFNIILAPFKWLAKKVGGK